MSLRICWIARPRGGEGFLEEQQEAVGRLRELGHRVSPRLTFEQGDAARFAYDAARARCDLVVAAGGDGTINEVVNGIVRSEWQPRLGVIAAGTANDFAKGLGVPEDVIAAAEAAVNGRPVAVDVARLNGRCFVNVSIGGFAAEVTRQAGRVAKTMLGPLAYLVTGAKQLAGLEPGEATFVGDGEELFRGRFLFFAVGNARQTGGGTPVTPWAHRSDGLLDVLIVPELTRWEFLTLLPDIRAGTHVRSEDVVYARVSRLVIECAEALAVNADGEPLCERTLRYDVLERPLSLMVPD